MKRYEVRPQNWPNESPEGNFVLRADAAIKAAVAEEREACAELCARFAKREMHPDECAATIRARSTP